MFPGSGSIRNTKWMLILFLTLADLTNISQKSQIFLVRGGLKNSDENIYVLLKNANKFIKNN